MSHQGHNILLMAIFFILVLKECKTKALPGGKELAIGKVQYMSHPEVAKWEREKLRRQAERRANKNSPPQIGESRSG